MTFLYLFYKKHKKTLEIGFNKVYHMQRYSGIVQSVEQRTVNPYVTGSSPVARATNSVAKSLILRRFSLLTLLDLGTLQSTQKHHYLTPWLHSSYTGSATYPQSDEQLTISHPIKKSTYFEHIAKMLGFLNMGTTVQSPVAILS